MSSKRQTLFVGILLAATGVAASATPSAASAASCAVELASITAPGCSLVKSDTAAVADPEPNLWGNIECQTDERHTWTTSGGDSHPTATGASQGDNAYRHLKLYETDTFASFRCELGRNEHRYGEQGGKGTFKLYREGERYITFASYKFLANTPLKHNTLFQTKQTQPSDNGGHRPILTLKAGDGYLILRNQESPGPGATVTSTDLWRAPIVTGVWARVAVDVTYSQYTDRGRVQVLFDRNGDGDALDANEASPVFTTHTLKYETPDSDGQANDTDGIEPGESIPSHLRLGMYPKEESVDCATEAGGHCAMAVDNIQVVKPASSADTPPPDSTAPDTTPPDTTIVDYKIESSSATFSFTSSEAASRFECQMDGWANWKSCASPHTLSSLVAGDRTFSVRAIDEAGNADATPATHSFVIATDVPPADSTPPETTITSGPSGTITTDGATFEFSSSESDSTFECRLDGTSWSSCTSPKSYGSLAEGQHVFEVRASDAAANVDQTPATTSFTVDLPDPPAEETPSKPGKGNGKGSPKLRLSSTTSTISSGESIQLLGRVRRIPGSELVRSQAVIQAWRAGGWARLATKRLSRKRFRLKTRIAATGGEVYFRAKIRRVGRSRPLTVAVRG